VYQLVEGLIKSFVGSYWSDNFE